MDGFKDVGAPGAEADLGGWDAVAHLFSGKLNLFYI